MKPLGIKNYGSIPHLPGSRLGPGDHKVHEGQERICNEAVRDRHDVIIVQEKLDGSNVGVCKKDGIIHALTRAGYLASSSPYEQHHMFGKWVSNHCALFDSLLNEGERFVGEWLMQAHGTRYDLRHSPFVVFDLMDGAKRASYDALTERVAGKLFQPFLIHRGGALSIADAMAALGEFGKHGSLDPVEGAVWRVERKGEVDFLAKYVRPDKVDGCYLESQTNGPTVWNITASKLFE